MECIFVLSFNPLRNVRFLKLQFYNNQNCIIIHEFKKFAILKKGIGIESQNLCKFNDQKIIQTRWNSTVAIEQKVDSKAFAIPILTASAFII